MAAADPIEKPGAHLRVVALGGGTGMTALLTGMSRIGADVTAIVTVADDGGSSGRLRKSFDIPPPGDLRNCLVAMSESDPLIKELFQYRFEESVLKGHSFGNLFIAVLTKLSGDFRLAIEQSRELLSVSGRVIPSTLEKVVLVASHVDGGKSTGEQAISRSARRIESMCLQPKPSSISDEIRKVLTEADLICLGPGSLYTSIIPNLLVPGMIEAVTESPAEVVYVANLMTQPGETDHMALSDHVAAIEAVDENLQIDRVLVPEDAIYESALLAYAQENSFPLPAGDAVRLGRAEVSRQSIVAEGDQIRHDPSRLTAALLQIVGARR